MPPASCAISNVQLGCRPQGVLGRLGLVSLGPQALGQAGGVQRGNKWSLGGRAEAHMLPSLG